MDTFMNALRHYILMQNLERGAPDMVHLIPESGPIPVFLCG